MASPLGFLRSGPPPPNVVLLPDSIFFTRAVPVTLPASPAEIGSQIELALEAASPFPLTQLYYGWFLPPGGAEALVFAAYRRRLTADQVSQWDSAQLVIPAFAALLGAQVEPATSVVISAAEEMTVLHWSSAGAAPRVLVRALDPATDEEARAKVRDELLRAAGESKAVVDLAAPSQPEPARDDRQIVFRNGELVSRLPAPVVATADVRDKIELAAIRRARRRDVVLWRVTLGSVAALLLLGIGELGLAGARAWQRVQKTKIAAQKPLVDKIRAADDLARRIDELATLRLLPFEMITLVQDQRPPGVIFTRVQAAQRTGIHTLTVSATAPAAQADVFRSALEKMPACERVVMKIERSSGETATFTVTVTFKPDAIKPADPVST